MTSPFTSARWLTEDGGTVKLGFLSGHDARFYEYRFYSGGGTGIFRVSRNAFLEALGALGIRPPSPEGRE